MVRLSRTEQIVREKAHYHCSQTQYASFLLSCNLEKIILAVLRAITRLLRSSVAGTWSSCLMHWADGERNVCLARISYCNRLYAEATHNELNPTQRKQLLNNPKHQQHTKTTTGRQHGSSTTTCRHTT
jgi:hypothetical protein